MLTPHAATRMSHAPDPAMVVRMIHGPARTHPLAIAPDPRGFPPLDTPLAALSARVVAHADTTGAGESPTETGVPGLSFVRARSPTDHEPMLYEPLVCVVLQGAKETLVGERVVPFAAGRSLIVSFDLPALSRIRQASPGAPYVALALKLDLGLVRDLDADQARTGAPSPADSAVVAGPADGALLDAMSRLFDLVGRVDERTVMLPLLLREVHFQLLRAEHGGMLRRLANRHGHASSIARAVARLRRDYASALSVADLARAANMSASTFHERFKAVSPGPRRCSSRRPCACSPRTIGCAVPTR